MSDRIWLNPDFIKNCFYVQSHGVETDYKERLKLYEIYEHAENILSKNPNEHDLICAIFQLNRAIELRDKQLNKNYKFKKIPSLIKKYEQHLVMEELGIIKPLLKNKLNTIRNQSAHSTKYPALKLSEIKELAEFTWYFLRSTDLIASRKPDSIIYDNSIFEAEDDEPSKALWIELNFNLDTWEIELRGNIYSDKISHDYRKTIYFR